MDLMKQSFNAVTYHKKSFTLFFAFFSGLLLLLTILSQLIATQRATMIFFDGKVTYFKKVSSHFNAKIGQELIQTNTSVMHFYQTLYIGCLLLALLLFVIIGFMFAKSRREEIQALYFMGIKQIKILNQLIVELIFPITASVLSISILLLLFQGPFVAKTTTLNQVTVKHSLLQQNIVVNPYLLANNGSNKTSNGTALSSDNIQTTNKGLLPFNEASLFESQIGLNSSTHIIKQIVANAVLLTLVAVIGASVSFGINTKFLFSRRD